MRFQGIYTPIITPFKQDGSIDWESYADVIEWQIERGVAGIVVGGSTGEFYALSKEERLLQFKFAGERINGRVEFMAGVNDIRCDESLLIASAAAESGADSLLVAAPPYSLPSEAELAHHVLQIANTVKLPVMLYNYPGRTGVDMGEEFLSLIANNPFVVAIKESSGDYSRLPLLAQYAPDVELVIGGEEQVLEFAAWGAKAWVCATGNIFPEECARMMSIVSIESDFKYGKRLMDCFMPLMSILEQGGNFLQSVKYACEVRGRPGGIVRPPLMPLENSLKETLASTVLHTQDSVNTVFQFCGER